MTPLDTAWLTYSHPNKRFGHIPARRSTRTAYCATHSARGRAPRHEIRPVEPGGTLIFRWNARAPDGAYPRSASTPPRNKSRIGHNTVQTLRDRALPGATFYSKATNAS